MEKQNNSLQQCQKLFRQYKKHQKNMITCQCVVTTKLCVFLV